MGLREIQKLLIQNTKHLMLKTQKVTVIIIHNTITTGFYTDRSNLSKADRQPALLVLSHFVF